MKVLDLFSGTQSIKPVCDELGWEYYSLDKYEPSTYQEDILDWDYKNIDIKFDIIWASPCCLPYSNLTHSWRGRVVRGELMTAERLEEGMKEGDKLVKKALEIIDYFKPTYWFIENPDNGGTSYSNVVEFNKNGNVCVGNGNPTTARLEVRDSSANNYGTTIRLSQGYNSVFSEIASNFGGSMTLNAGEGTTSAIMHFQVNNSDKMRLNNSGQLLVGTTSATSLGNHTGASNVSTFNQSGITLTQYGVTAGFYYDRLNFTNSQYFIVNSSGTGVYLGNGSTSFTAHSDERLKENITELDGTKAYNHVKTARAASFKWKATGYPTDTKIGFIAQDWEINYPEVTNSTTEIIDEVENPKGIQYTETIPVLMAALKQAIIKIETLETEVAALKAA